MGRYSEGIIVKLAQPIVGYKQVYGPNGGKKLVTLIIPRGALVHWPRKKERWGDPSYVKFRASSAYVAEGSGHAGWDRSFKYEEGLVVRPKGDRFLRDCKICAPGIHFFLMREEAVGYTA